LRLSAPALDPARLRQVGVTVAARRSGPFALDIRRIGPSAVARERCRVQKVLRSPSAMMF